MTAIVPTIQILSAIALIILVLLNRTSGDTGGSSFGDASFLHTRRGSERLLFTLTIIVAVVFAASSIAAVALA